ncbi:uncharacterized protein Dwil_GK15029 [Drosophila willistoni]|uniref:Casein kinase substrate phosphoprotein PP28 domain-containing protein n=1 Tax=Drosophila willistoni TaxID=7260 RepID=B4MVM8_DROWI|nr:28 kDa heat- and acid-stable phosphoprotein [Drosophila willistoni]EDW75748.1 uncharacterized protein Dwil_GK15029 [Drosophila willistoni]
MPRGKFVNHKGRSRNFSTPEEMREDLEDESDRFDSGNEEEPQTASTSKPKEKVINKNSDSDDEIDDEQIKTRDAKKGVAALIDIENPNRRTQKVTKNLSRLTMEEVSSSRAPKPELSRRQREQIEHQKAQQRYEKLHAAGKTNEAKADLARLAVIRQQREEAAAKREAAKKANEAAKGTKK